MLLVQLASMIVFLFHLITKRYCFYLKVYCYPDISSNRNLLAFFDTSVLKVRILHYLRNNSAILT